MELSAAKDKQAALEDEIESLKRENAVLKAELEEIKSSAIVLTAPAASPLAFPLRKVMIIYTVVLTDGLVSSSLFPMVPYLIRDCGVAEPDVGYYAGMLASVYNLMQFLSAAVWGRFSDRYGRKPVIYLGLLAAVASQLLFGLSKSVGHAVACRALGGLLCAQDRRPLTARESGLPHESASRSRLTSYSPQPHCTPLPPRCFLLTTRYYPLTTPHSLTTTYDALLTAP